MYDKLQESVKGKTRQRLCKVLGKNEPPEQL